jgi:hypothetical protein
MFVRYFAELGLPLEEVERAFLRSPEEWIPGLASDARARGELLLAEVGFGSPGLRLTKQVQIELGEPIRFPSRTVLPMTWRPATQEDLFPALDADVEVASLGPDRTQFSISARYLPPLGLFGRAIDRALMHRVAEATMKDFVDLAADALGGLVLAAIPAT